MPTPARPIIRAAASAAAAATLALAGCSSTPTAQPAPSAAVPVTSAAPITTGAPVTPTAESTTTAGPATSATTTAPTRAAATTAPPARNLGVVQIVRTGGLAGITQTITVLPDGRWTVKTDRGQPTRTGTLTAAQHAQLKKLLADPRLAREAAAKSGEVVRCADAFTYVVATGQGVVRYTSCGSKDKPEVTLAIITLLQSATKGQ
ncbi:hypothetical protein ACQP2F_21755 [Actinoplanes sp. CA-030573]|uniref:hypothetical protein n=1 Tax=Actinoplanes sp. CA-030573 TaxID=3239898 RepID=UPI003D8B0A28